MYNPKDPASVEKYSCALTLSDMEVFIFPELLYSLVLANIMSPALWQWKNDTWFNGLQKQSPYRRLLRVKQYIMDHFSFNLDLDTWGLTTKEQELARFSGFISQEALSQSNALFGYEGDKYYFDIDIRRHFGLDKYNSEVIPYWKTETLEAMQAFKHKPGYAAGAGECVSLSTLYASAMFTVGNIPLDDIFLLATPLHSQNFIDINEGVITNNRRIVTKNMWFNGTELSEKARRAVEHERITIVSHHTGLIHTLYDTATISQDAYKRFSDKFTTFLKTDITFEILANFLRQNSKLQKCFQIAHLCCGKPRFIEAEKVYSYEHNSTFKVSDKTRPQLLHEIDEDEFYPDPIANRLLLDEVEEFFKVNKIPIDNLSSVTDLEKQLNHGCGCYDVNTVVKDLYNFCKISPKLPPTEKQWQPSQPLEIKPDWHREQIVEYLDSIRSHHAIADLAIMAYRDMKKSPWLPFYKAAFERNPVCISGSLQLETDVIFQKLKEMPGESIYSGTRMAQPDEVWNFGRGDGLEKAICLVTILKKRYSSDSIRLECDGKKAVVSRNEQEFIFETSKGLETSWE
jgi:hypothetical protein